MRFPSPLVEARLLRRYKRFLADVEFPDGRVVTVHCANPGAMTGLAAEGSRVFLSHSADPRRALAWSWEIIEADGTFVGINTGLPNRLAVEAIESGRIRELADYARLRREVPYGEGSRVDIVLSDDGRPDAYVEVKNVHLLRRPGLAEFPDSVTSRGARHLDELAAVAKAGSRAVMLFLIQRGDADRFGLARDIDRAYSEAFDRARSAGVEMLAWRCNVSLDEIVVAEAIPHLG